MDIARRQGVGALYRGLSAGLLRQATYTTARLGIYDTIFAAAKKFNDNKVGGRGGWLPVRAGVYRVGWLPVRARGLRR